jgi:hypothetical protein
MIRAQRSSPARARPLLVTSTGSLGANDRIKYSKNTARHHAFAGAFHNPWRMHMSDLSRRSLVASAAALPALAVPAVAASVGTTPHPDARLIALGEAYASLVPLQEAAQEVFNDRCWLAEDLAWQRLGFETKPDYCSPELRERWCVEYEKTGKEQNVEALFQKLESVNWQIDPIAREIRDTPAQTIAGLRAKAIDAIFLSWQLWEKSTPDLDWEQRALRSLLEAVCTLTGLDIPEEAVEDEAVRS